ncbi:sulfate ABC transporter substrate-binding protein [Methylovulum psychrotolerans]|uniref:ABC transporter permease n=1 Tax=Methylovulum psychrotolerans TaxID=1704499 RepID=A0A1Z4C1K2_9GAMM|nr:sulfate ABC transporter substrate-binding protein [Methylovulum psychrotolerans]ASF47389.1 ABC transporter permease [Methylovulum psychrotolerans]POZ51947.1 sulfate ABC transporter substrate-binding protein [Methylovulum psychrotolerans]
MTFTTKLTIAIFAGLFAANAATADQTLLNVSYDPTRELFQDFNKAFISYWKTKSGETVKIEQSHGGSGKQARSVIEGREADVLTLAITYDIDKVAEKAKLLPNGWQTKLPNNSIPYTSTVVFLVRKDNPKGIKDWDDLVKADVTVVTPNPKTSGVARYNYLAAWAFAEKKYGGKEAAKHFLKELYKNVPILDSGSRAATTTFLQRGVGDVLLTWENEAFLAVKELGEGQVEIVAPSTSILAELPVAVVDSIAKKHGTEEAATAYLQYLYTPIGQKLAAKHYFRPISPQYADAADLNRFSKMKLFTVKEGFGSWEQAQKEHFDDNGIFDQLYVPSFLKWSGS